MISIKKKKIGISIQTAPYNCLKSTQMFSDTIVANIANYLGRNLNLASTEETPFTQSLITDTLKRKQYRENLLACA